MPDIKPGKKIIFYILDTLLILSALFYVALFSFYAYNMMYAKSSLHIILLPLSMIVAVVLPFLLHRPLKKLLKKLYFPAKVIFTILLTANMVLFFVFCSFVLNYSQNTIEAFADQNSDEKIAVLVFGCRTYGYTPSEMLARRLNKAFELLEEYPESICIVSGGQGSDESVAEAEAMRAYLENMGIAPERIYKEDKASSTNENVDFSMKLIEENSLEEYKLVGISTDFHIPRIELYCDYHEIDITLIPSQSKNKSFLMGNIAREYLAYFKTLLIDVR